jgi:hypothetical protein
MTYDEMLEALRGYTMTAAEKREHAISFVYGNCVLSNPNVTREMVERAWDERHARNESDGEQS